MTRATVWNLDPTTYKPHALHVEECAWLEKNCYIDVWIEVLHALRLDPMAVMPFTLTVDFEGDQWTFFKPSPDDLNELYGVEVHELNVWRPLLAHAVQHVGDGKLVLTEADAFFLPDAAGTDYHRQHTKSTIAIETVDPEARRLGYFHNGGYYRLEGSDFASVFGLDVPADPARLPLFAEIVRLDRIRRLSRSDLVEQSIVRLVHHMGRRPLDNPVARFEAQFERDLETFASDALVYHAYAFATLRQLGASFELASRYLSWLDDGFGDIPLLRAAEAFMDISSTAKAMVLKGARAVVGGKHVDFAPMLGRMRERWDTGMGLLDRRFGSQVGAVG
ncbi:MAG TPA: DUF1839 family protein [Polyangiaceae bacterium]